MAANYHRHLSKLICHRSRLRDVKERQPWPRSTRKPKRQAQQGWRSRPCCPNDQCPPYPRRTTRDRLYRLDCPAGQLGRLDSTAPSHLLQPSPRGVFPHPRTSSSGRSQRSAGTRREGHQQPLRMMFRHRSPSRLGLVRPRLTRQQQVARRNRRHHASFAVISRSRIKLRDSIRRQLLTVVIQLVTLPTYCAAPSLRLQTRLEQSSPGAIIILHMFVPCPSLSLSYFIRAPVLPCSARLQVAAQETTPITSADI